MQFEKYQHIMTIGKPEVDGLLIGKCHVFPKIDGTNSSIWLEDGEICCGSRNRKLSADDDNAGFYAWVHSEKIDTFTRFFNEHPDLRLCGEWLVPHTIKTYRKDAWRRFYVFDVMLEEEYLPYESYVMIADYGIDVIPPQKIVSNPTIDLLTKFLPVNTYLIEDGMGAGEGIVIKNYGFVNRFGRCVWGKIVRNEFKEENRDAFGTKEIRLTDDVEIKIVEQYITRSLIDKELSKILLANEVTEFDHKFIPRLLTTVYYCLITDDLYEAIKKYKFPVIDFKRLDHLVKYKIKELAPELF